MRKITTILTITAIIVFGFFLFSNWRAYTNFLPVNVLAEQNNVSPYLIMAIIKVESNFKKDAESRAGAKGLMQLMPETSAWIAGKLNKEDNSATNSWTNMEFGTWYFGSFLLPKYNGNQEKALAAYNAGHGNVDNWADGEIPFPETKNYVKKVMWWANLYKFTLGIWQ